MRPIYDLMLDTWRDVGEKDLAERKAGLDAYKSLRSSIAVLVATDSLVTAEQLKDAMALAHQRLLASYNEELKK